MRSFEEFLKWEDRSKDTIDFKKIYVDIAGDLNAGLMLSELIYWYLPSKKGHENKLSVERDGFKWVAIHRVDWWDRTRMSPDQSDRAIALLIKKGLIVKKLYGFANKVTIHVRIIQDVFLKLINEEIDNPTPNPFREKAEMYLRKRAKCKSVKTENAIAEKPEIHLSENGKSYITENTSNDYGTENTTEIKRSAPPLVPVVTSAHLDALIFTPEMLPPKPDALKEKAQAERSANTPTPISAPPPPKIEDDDFNIVRLHRETWPKTTITPALKDILFADAKKHPREWIIDAFKHAAMNDAKTYRYVNKILMDWEANGKPNLAIVPKSADTTPAPVWTPPEGVNPFRPALPKVSGDNGHAT